MPTGDIKDGDARFARGMDSVSDASTLPPESYAWAVNMLNRGGVLQTRPGFKTLSTLPDGKLQGFTIFRPRLGVPVLIAIVNGVPYQSRYPYTSFTEIPGDTMSADADRVYTCQATQSVQRNADGSLKLIPPRNLLMFQDGINPPAYFDGRKLTKITGRRKTPQGTHMVWAGGRLWVARREQLFAGDIADPLSFWEQEFNTLGGISYFVLPGACTGFGKTPGNKVPLMAFTESTGTLFRSDILNRSLWSQTPDFQLEILPSIGCVAPRSIVSHNGMLWWYSEFGTVRIDGARLSEVSGAMRFLDREMVRSGKAVGENASAIAAASYENFLMFSVPHASRRNQHTWLLDASNMQTLNEEMPPVWSSVWTGVSPVEWARATVNGQVRLFCASVDDDGKNRVYEAFTAERRDNGCDIPWAFDTRAYTGGALSPKHFRYAEYALSELQGQVDLRISWAGAGRGRWKKISTPTFFAPEGNVVAGEIYGPDAPMFALKKQSRLARTEDVRDKDEDALSSAGVEGPCYTVEADKEAIDTAFQLRFEGSGPCAIRSLRVFMDAASEPDSGMQDKAETGDRYVRADGAASKDLDDLAAAPETFSADGTASASWNNFVTQATATVTSTVSQAEATKRAAQVATARAEHRLRKIATPYTRTL